MQHPYTCGHVVFWMMQPERCWQALRTFIPLTVDDLCTFCTSPIKSNEARCFSRLNQRINRNNNGGSHIALVQWMVPLEPSELRCKWEPFPPLVKPHMQHSFLIFLHFFFFTLMVKVCLSLCLHWSRIWQLWDYHETDSQRRARSNAVVFLVNCPLSQTIHPSAFHRFCFDSFSLLILNWMKRCVGR